MALEMSVSSRDGKARLIGTKGQSVEDGATIALQRKNGNGKPAPLGDFDATELRDFVKSLS